MGFEMPGNADSWYACLGEQGHLWVYWLQPLDLCKALLSIIFPPLLQRISFKLFQNASHTPSSIGVPALQQHSLQQQTSL